MDRGLQNYGQRFEELWTKVWDNVQEAVIKTIPKKKKRKKAKWLSEEALQIAVKRSESEVAQSCPTLSDSMDCSPPDWESPRPWDSPGKNTGVGCHFLIQCMQVKSESEVAQSCPTLWGPMDCSPPGSSIHGIF